MPKVDLDDVYDLLPQANYYRSSSKPYLATRCVFHTDSDPSLLINALYYSCQSCGAHGTTVKLLNFLKTGVLHAPSSEKSFRPTIWRYLKDGEIDIEEVAIEAKYRLKKFPDYAVYLNKRGIGSMIESLGIGFLDGWYTFPILDQDSNIIGLVARAGGVIQSQTKFRYMSPPNQPVMLYVPEWKRVLEGQALYLTYGIIDAISVAMIGLPSASYSLGHKTPSELLSFWRKRIYLIPDGDRKDDKAVIQLAQELGWRAKIIEIEYPAHNKDCNDLLRNFGADYLRNILLKASSMDDTHTYRIKVKGD